MLTYDKLTNEIKLYTRGNSKFGQDTYLQKYLTLPKLKNNELIDDDKVYAVRGNY